MVATTRVFGSFAVNDIHAAQRFYRDTLGIEVSMVSDQGPLFLHGPDGHDTLVYAKPDHVPATFTVLNLSVPDIEDAVGELAATGVEFERYPGLETDAHGIYRAEGRSVAWFTDPAGNVLSLVQFG